MRWAAFGTYVWAFKCNMKEAEVEDVTNYESLGKFFTRHLKDGARTIDKDHDLVRIVVFGNYIHCSSVYFRNLYSRFLIIGLNHCC